MKTLIFVIVYLCSIIMANLAVNRFGTIAVIPVGFLLVGLDITTRDYLHEAWAKNRYLKLGLLIGFGSLISWLLNKDAGMIALASFVAFASASIVDTVTYSILYKRGYLIKVNGSNLFSSLTDSVVFLTIAFGAFMPILVLEQFLAKFLGGFLWALVLHKTQNKVRVTA